MIPKIGMVVIYNTTEEERKMMYDHPDCNVQMKLPAIIVAVHGASEGSCVNLKVICDGKIELWKTSVVKGDNEMNWNFKTTEEDVQIESTTDEEIVDELTAEVPKITPGTSEENTTEEVEFHFVAIINRQIAKPVILADSKENAYLKFNEEHPFCTVIECNQVE